MKGKDRSSVLREAEFPGPGEGRAAVAGARAARACTCPTSMPPSRFPRRPGLSPEPPVGAPGAHVIAETAQHADHADIIREYLDGAKSMG